MHLERLIHLARKTGDRLIVHDSVKGNDIVIMDIDSYERICNKNTDADNLDKSNFADKRNENADMEGLKFDLNKSNNNIDNDFYAEPSSWHSAADVLDNSYEMDNLKDAREYDNGAKHDVSAAQYDNNFDNGASEQRGIEPWSDEPIPDYEDGGAAIDMSYQEQPDVSDWEEESLEEEPVFYEEPV